MKNVNVWWLLAAVAMAAIAALHIVGGGAELARPLLNQKVLGAAVTFNLYYAWHLVSVMLVAMALAYGAAAFSASHRSLGSAASLLALAFAVLNIVIGLQAGLYPWGLPQWVLFAPVAAVGFLGLFASPSVGRRAVPS